MKRRAFIKTTAGIFIPAVTGIAAVPFSTGDAAFTGRRRATGNSFPGGVAGVRGWWKADALSLNNNDLVTTWTDSSGNGWDMSNAGGVVRPVYKTNILNSKPAIYFDAGHHFSFPALYTGMTEGEVFWVLKMDTNLPATTIRTGLCYIGGYNSDYQCYPFTNNAIFDNTMSAQYRNWARTNDNTIGHVYNISSKANEWIGRYNSTAIKTDTTNTFSVTGANQFIGKSGHSSYHMYGHMAEMILYDHVLSAGDRTAVLSYLTGKYAI